jgi:hypothetical protein
MPGFIRVSEKISWSQNPRFQASRGVTYWKYGKVLRKGGALVRSQLLLAVCTCTELITRFTLELLHSGQLGLATSWSPRDSMMMKSCPQSLQR